MGVWVERVNSHRQEIYIHGVSINMYIQGVSGKKFLSFELLEV